MVIELKVRKTFQTAKELAKELNTTPEIISRGVKAGLFPPPVKVGETP